MFYNWSRSILDGYSANSCIIIYDGFTNMNHLSAYLVFGVAKHVFPFWSRSISQTWDGGMWSVDLYGSGVDYIYYYGPFATHGVARYVCSGRGVCS